MATRQQSRDRAPNQRLDARQNREAIIEAALTCLGRNPDASIAEIAAQARVARVTLYGHFATRTELVDAAVVRALDEGDAVLSALDLDGDPREALRRLVESTWELVDRSRALLTAAQKVLPPERIRALHARPFDRVIELVARGQNASVFRTDLPTSWLVTTMYSLMQAAVDEVNAGRLDRTEAAAYLATTVGSVFAAQPSQSDEATRRGRRRLN